MTEPTIDPEFSSQIPPLTPEELAGLEASLLAEGCRDALVVWQETNILLDGHNRLRLCVAHGIPFKTATISLLDREAAADWIDANQLGRRNLNPDAAALLRGRRYNRTKKAEHDGGKGKSRSGGQSDPHLRTADALAAQHGVSPRTVKRDGEFAAAVDELKATEPEIEQRINAGKTRRSTVMREVRRKRTVARRSADASATTIRPADADIRCCSMADLLRSGIKPDCILTDPPYPKEFLHLYDKLAELSVEIPLVAVMCGQSYLPDILASMTRHSRYRWTMAYLTPGGQAAQQWNAKINSFWKPVLLFGRADDWAGDVCRSIPNDNDKRFHDWGQSETGMMDLVERLSKPGQLVCDPFLGGGTTAVVCARLGRRFVGCDLDAECVRRALARLENETCKKVNP